MEKIFLMLVIILRNACAFRVSKIQRTKSSKWVQSFRYNNSAIS